MDHMKDAAENSPRIGSLKDTKLHHICEVCGEGERCPNVIFRSTSSRRRARWSAEFISGKGI